MRAATKTQIDVGPAATGKRGFLRLLAALALSLVASLAITATASATRIGAITNVSYSSAVIGAKITATGYTAYNFEYSTNNGTTWSSGPVEAVFANNGDVPIEPTLGGLRGGTTYAIRLAVNGVPTAPTAPPYPEFTTLAVEPPTILAINDASAVFSTSATLAGKVKRPANSDPAFDVTSCRFELVTDAQFTATGFQAATVEVCEPTTPYKESNGETEVGAHLTGLSPATTYHLRLAIENAAPGSVTKDATHTFTTAAQVAKPVIIAADDASELKINGGNALATFSGEVQRPLGEDPALDITCRFEFVTDAQFNANAPGEKFAGAGEAPCAQNPITKTSGNAEGKLPVNAKTFGSVKPETTYHLRLVAENSAGVVVKEAADTFTTLPPRFPVFTIDPPTPGYTTAEVSGTVNPEGGAVSNGNYLEWGFQYSTEPGNPNSWTYSSAAGYFYSTEETPIPVGGTMTGLTPGTTYYFRMYANNYLDIYYLPSPEPYLKFTTKGTSTLPSVTLEPVSDLTVNSAHFSGFVNTNAPPGPLNAEAKAAYKTDWRVECTPGCPGLSGTVAAEEGGKAIGGTVERLEGNTFYENVKLVAKNELGTVETPARSFQTPLVLPIVKASPGGSAGSGSYNVGGIVTPFNSKINNCRFEYGPTTEYVYSAPCTPNPVGRNEVQLLTLGLEPFKLVFRGQTTESMPVGASGALVEEELKALSAVGPEGISSVEYNGCFFCVQYTIHFSGPLAATNVGPVRALMGPETINSPGGTFAETLVQGGNNSPVLVEAHLTGLTPGATYHYKLVAANSLGTVSTDDQLFVPPLATGESACSNEQERTENSSARLPECRAYELVTNRPKGGFSASLFSYNSNETVAYSSAAGNINESGQGNLGNNQYVAKRGANGWETLAHLNGPKGTPYYPRGSVQAQYLQQYSPNLERSIWMRGVNGGLIAPYLREEDGTYIKINDAPPKPGFFGVQGLYKGASRDLSHVYWVGMNYLGEGYETGGGGSWAPGVGLGLYEFAGTGNTGVPRQVDLDNSGKPISECSFGSGFFAGSSEMALASADGETVFFTVKACEGHPQQMWARVNASKSYLASESQCTRTASDPGGACYTPPLEVGAYGEGGAGDAIYQSATLDGSRIYFTTSTQLVNGDINKSRDIYRYELPSESNPNPDPALIHVSNGGPNAQVKEVLRASEDGSTVYFVAKGVLASNEDDLGETAHDGDENMYVWEQNGSQPDGTTTFIGRLTDNTDLYIRSTSEITPDGRYFLFRSFAPITTNDTDNAADVYRYDVVTGEMLRISVGTSGTGGNGDGFNAEIPQAPEHTNPSIADDGQVIVFASSEALASDDGNGAPDVYIWKKEHTALLSTGSVGGGATAASVDASGRNIYFESSQQLTQDDTDSVSDVYDARVGGGVSFAKVESCSGESCQPRQTGIDPTPTPATSRSNGSGNYRRAIVSIGALSRSQLAMLALGRQIGLNVKVSGGGKVSLKGMSLMGKTQEQAFVATRRTVQPGQVQLPVSLSRNALAYLRKTGSLKLRLSVEFADAVPSTKSLTLTAPKAGKKRRDG